MFFQKAAELSTRLKAKTDYRRRESNASETPVPNVEQPITQSFPVAEVIEERSVEETSKGYSSRVFD